MAEGWVKMWDSDFHQIGRELDDRPWPPTLIDLHIKRLLDPGNPNPRPSNRSLARLWGVDERTVRRKFKAQTEVPHPVPHLRRTSVEEQPALPGMRAALAPHPAPQTTTIREALREAETPPNPPRGEWSGVPSWARAAAPRNPKRALQLATMVSAFVEAVQQRPPRGGGYAPPTSAKPVMALWRALGKPDPDQFKEQLVLVAEAGHRCPHQVFARDIRAEGWKGRETRQYDVTTLSVQRRWDERLRVAEQWEAEGRPEWGTRPGDVTPNSNLSSIEHRDHGLDRILE